MYDKYSNFSAKVSISTTGQRLTRIEPQFILNIRHDVELEDDENALVMSHHDDMQHARHETHDVLFEDGNM